MTKKELFSPKRQIKILEQNQQTVILTPDGIATEPLAKALKAEAETFLSSKLWGIMEETLRADAVDIGIVNYREESHALYAKAIFYVLEMQRKTMEELRKLKIDVR